MYNIVNSSAFVNAKVLDFSLAANRPLSFVFTTVATSTLDTPPAAHADPDSANLVTVVDFVVAFNAILVVFHINLLIMTII